MTTALMPTDSRVTRFEKQMAGYYKQFGALLPKGFPEDRFARMAVNAVQGVPKLLECDPITLKLALFNCAALGLEPNGPTHEAVIVPRAGRAMLQVEYKGWTKLARESGEVVNLQKGSIYKGDKLEHARGTGSFFRHIQSMPWDREGELPIGYYSVVEWKSGGVDYIIMSRKEVEAHRDKYSDAYRRAEESKKKDSPWHTAFDAMAEKTCVHKLAWALPKKAQQAVTVEQAQDLGWTARPRVGGEDIEIIEGVVDLTDTTDTEKVVEEVQKAAPPPPADEKFDRRREELRTRPSPEGPVRTPTPAPVPAEKPAADEPEPPGPPEGFGIQAGDAYRVGYDRETNAIFMRGAAHPITSEPVRTNQGKAKEPLRCAWCGELIHVGEQYYDGRRNMKACFRCFPEGTDAAEGPVRRAEEPPSPAEPEEEAPPVPTGVGPSKEARQAVLDAPELKAPTAAQGTITGDQLKALLSTAESGCPGKNAQERRDHWLIAVEREFPGIESAAEIPASGYLRAMRLAMGEG